MLPLPFDLLLFKMEEEFNCDERNIRGNGKEAKKRVNKKELREREYKAITRANQSAKAKEKPVDEESDWKKSDEKAKKKEELRLLYEQDLKDSLPKKKGQIPL